MRTLFFSVLALALFSCGTNRAVYQSPDLSEKTARHKTVAILPVRLVQTGYTPKDADGDDAREANEKLGYVFQETLQTFVLRQTAGNKKGTMVSFQSTQKTNALLTKQGWHIDDLYGRSPEELARLLGVDAVIMTTLNHNKNLSDGMAYGIAAARTVIGVLSKKPVLGSSPNASDVSIHCSLYDAADSKLLWKTYRDGSTNLPSNVEGLIEQYSNWIAKKLPYRS